MYTSLLVGLLLTLVHTPAAAAPVVTPTATASVDFRVVIPARLEVVALRVQSPTATAQRAVTVDTDRQVVTFSDP